MPDEDTDSFDLLDDGRVRVRFDGQDYFLKTPKLKEYRELKGEVLKTNAAMKESAEESKDLPEWEIPDPSEFLAPLCRRIFDTLGDRGLPDDNDELPTWLVTTGEPYGAMLQHWRTVPLGRGRPVPPR